MRHIRAHGERSLLSGLPCQTGQWNHAEEKVSIAGVALTILAIPEPKAVRTHCTMF